MVALRGSLRMEEPEQAPLSIAGLVNFGKTCFANALLQVGWTGSAGGGHRSDVYKAEVKADRSCTVRCCAHASQISCFA